MNTKKACVGLMVVLSGAVAAGGAIAAAKTTVKKQSAIQNGTTVRTKVAATGLYDQECYDAFYGCMDQFCITENSNGGSCACSDDNAKYEKEFDTIRDMLEEADRIRTVEVEKVKLGAQADIVFNGSRQYDEKGNVLGVDERSEADKKKEARESLLSMFNNSFDEDDEDDADDIFNKTGAALYRAAQDICLEQIPDSCDKDIKFLQQIYARQIVADCKAFENVITTKKAEAETELAAANAEVRNAYKETLDEANKYDLGTCMVEFKKCMLTDDACGKNWENCVSTVAKENMQNNEAVSTAKTKVATVDKYDITASTLEMLDSKKFICERVLNQCMAVRNEVWPAFLREAAPTIKVAEASAESKFRQSCLTNISDCIQTACKDDIAGKGVATMDACLANPDMARSFCKVEIDPCERMEPLIWSYVKSKLDAMQIDACTQEIKDCFTHEDRCGKNFQNCIGMDYDYIHAMCPIETLVVCKQGNSAFEIDDLDDKLMGLYLNIDNAALEQCQELVDQRMAEICGSTTDCNKFAADDTLGTGSLRSQKDDTTYRVTGMISFGSIKMGDATGKTEDNGEGGKVRLGPGEIGVQEYMAKVREKNAGVENIDGIMSSIEEELNNIAGTINRVIELIEQDPQIQFCVNGRDLSQITGKKNQTTTARFPNLLNQVKMQIAIAALRQAQDNYNAKLNKEIAEATKGASTDLAQYMCQKIAQNGGGMVGVAAVDTPLAPPYAVSYEVGAGLSTEDLTKGGFGETKFQSSNGSGVTKETSALFNRDTRMCHVCTTVTTMSCSSTGGSLFHRKKSNCNTDTQGPTCEDIAM